jgi:hypothetical protein
MNQNKSRKLKISEKYLDSAENSVRTYQGSRIIKQASKTKTVRKRKEKKVKTP